MAPSDFLATFHNVLNNWFQRTKQKHRNYFQKCGNNAQKSTLHRHCCASKIASGLWKNYLLNIVHSLYSKYFNRKQQWKLNVCGKHHSQNWKSNLHIKRHHKLILLEHGILHSHFWTDTTYWSPIDSGYTYINSRKFKQRPELHLIL